MGMQEWLEKDYYAALGVPKTADATEIKKAYRKLARELHPDRNKDNKAAEDRFKEVSEAYDVLSDPEERRKYDETRSTFAGGRNPFGAGGAGGHAPGGATFDMGDLFGQAGGGGGLGDLFGTVFGGGGRTRTRGTGPRRGADIESEVTLDFTEAVSGVTVPLRLASAAPCADCRGTGAKAGTVPRVCPDCEGTGHVSRSAGQFGIAEPCRACFGRGLVVDDPCPSCQGSGRGRSQRTIQARIPAGVRDGQRIRLKGKGAPGERGGPAGDLNLAVHVSAHPVFGRSADNLTVTVPVTFPEAALGGEITVPTLDGQTVRLKIPDGTPSGRTFRVRGKGVQRKDGTTGDLLVTVDVAVPQRLPAEAREALSAFAEHSDPDVRSELIARARAAATAGSRGSP